MIMSRFIHLHTHSAYSLAEGAIKVKDLIALAKANNMPAVAVTDSNNMFGALEFAMEARKNGIQPIIGSQVLIGDQEHQLVLLVQNEDGFRNLSKLMSDAYLEGDSQHAAAIDFDVLKGNAEGLICLTGGSKGPAHKILELKGRLRRPALYRAPASRHG